MKYFLLFIVSSGLWNNGLQKMRAGNFILTIPDKITKQDTGWKSLFDGKTLKGWHTYGDAVATSAWRVDSGVIHLDASNKNDNDETINGGDLLTNNEYSNFDLKLEWKISRGGNSGIKFYVQEDTTKYDEAIGLEMQVVDNKNHEDGKRAKHRAGSLYDLIAPTAAVAKNFGEWNDAEIKCYNGELGFYLNGTKIMTTTLWDDNWRKMIAHSKYKRMKDWGTFKTGHIALQDHGFDVWYKNIIIKKLQNTSN
jgi:3-keto-disaccharide hydrolase